MSRSALGRMLGRHGVSRLPPLENEDCTVSKRFKAYDRGFIHIDVKYPPPARILRWQPEFRSTSRGNEKWGDYRRG